ncbi:MAG: hypothetical protein AB8G05_01255 [Oligoflexales bacterium]
MFRELKTKLLAILLLAGWSVSALSGTDGGYHPSEVEIQRTAKCSEDHGCGGGNG